MKGGRQTLALSFLSRTRSMRAEAVAGHAVGELAAADGFEAAGLVEAEWQH